jgi:hypothetical protein
MDGHLKLSLLDISNKSGHRFALIKRCSINFCQEVHGTIVTKNLSGAVFRPFWGKSWSKVTPVDHETRLEQFT